MRKVIIRRKSGRFVTLSRTGGRTSWHRGGLTFTTETPQPDLTVTSVNMGRHNMHVHLSDGRVVKVPFSVTPRLLNATPKQRRHWRLIGQGLGIHWEDIDEDLSVAGLVRDYAE